MGEFCLTFVESPGHDCFLRNPDIADAQYPDMAGAQKQETIHSLAAAIAACTARLGCSVGDDVMSRQFSLPQETRAAKLCPLLTSSRCCLAMAGRFDV